MNKQYHTKKYKQGKQYVRDDRETIAERKT